mgnify:CR=1 FL=1
MAGRECLHCGYARMPMDGEGATCPKCKTDYSVPAKPKPVVVEPDLGRAFPKVHRRFCRIARPPPESGRLADRGISSSSRVADLRRALTQAQIDSCHGLAPSAGRCRWVLHPFVHSKRCVNWRLHSALTCEVHMVCNARHETSTQRCDCDARRHGLVLLAHRRIAPDHLELASARRAHQACSRNRAPH